MSVRGKDVALIQDPRTVHSASTRRPGSVTHRHKGCVVLMEAIVATVAFQESLKISARDKDVASTRPTSIPSGVSTVDPTAMLE